MTSATFGAGSGRTAVSQINCVGDEYDLDDCTSKVWFFEGCYHSVDAGVSCKSKLINL